jgi:hypothetical protein
MIRRLVLLAALSVPTFACAEDLKPLETMAVTAGDVPNASREFEPVHALAFFDRDGNEVGRLDWKGGKAKFSGKADKAAKVFFDQLIKVHLQPALDESNAQSASR